MRPAFCLLPLFLLLVLFLRQKAEFFWLILYAAVFAAGWAAFIFAFDAPAGTVSYYTDELVYVEGTVTQEPLVFDGYTEYRLSVKHVERGTARQPARGALLVRIYGQEETFFGYGEDLRIRGTVVEPKKMRNPGGFDYNLYLKTIGIDALIYPSAQAVESLGPGAPNIFAAPFIRLRVQLTENIESFLPEPANHLLTAILFGQKNRLPPEVEENFRKAGAGHLMAVSGLHVGLVAAFIASLFALLGLKGRGPQLAALVLVLAYACLTGLKPSAVRAALMVAAGLGALIFERDSDVPSAIALAALVTLIYNPLLLFAVGFQLSYMAAIAVIYAHRPLAKLFQVFKLPRFLRDLLAVTLAAQLGVLPLTAFHFHTLSTGALFYNLLLIPMMSFIVGFGLSGAVLSLLLPRLSMVLLNAVYPLLQLMMKITSLGEHPALYLSVCPPGLWSIFFYYSLAALFLFIYYQWPSIAAALEKKEHSLGLFVHKVFLLFKPGPKAWLRLGVVVLAVLVIFSWGSIFKDGASRLEVTFIDVGQGAAAYIKTPCGAVVLIDAGGKPDYYGNPGETGEKIVLPFLLYSKAKRIDLAVITHPHEDHYGGFIPLLENIKFKKLLISPAPGEAEHYINLIDRARAKNIEVIEAVRGQVWTFPCGLILEVLGPPDKLYQATSSDLNNNSVVTMLHYQGHKMLFTGDIEEAAVEDLLRAGVSLKADLLQIPHHGGLLTCLPELLTAVDPKLAVIQVGTNSFGHPHAATIKALEAAGVITYRNDLDGAITVTINQEKMTAEGLESGLVAR